MRKPIFQGKSPNLRNKQVAFYISEDTERALKLTSVGFGFTTPSQFLAFIIERCVYYKWTAVGFARVGLALHDHAEEYAGGFQGSLDLGFLRPPLPLPEYPLSKAEIRKICSDLRAQLEAELTATPEEKPKPQTKEKKR